MNIFITAVDVCLDFGWWCFVQDQLTWVFALLAPLYFWTATVHLFEEQVPEVCSTIFSSR